MTFVNQEYDLQAAAERYTRELCAYRALDHGQQPESLKKATRELAAAALRFSASAVDDRYVHPNAKTRELPSWLEYIARRILDRLAAEHDAGRNLYTAPPGAGDAP